MRQKTEYSDFFDDDFEVTYEEMPGGPESAGSRQNTPGSRRKETEERLPHRRRDDTQELDLYDAPRKKERSSVSGKRRKQKSGVPLAAPIRKGGRALSRLAQTLIRSLTAVLILAVCCYVVWTFWRASAPYGDIIDAADTRKLPPSLAAYLCVPALFLIFELISLLWSMTRVRVRDGRESWKEDTGRGLFSFIAVFISSYACFLVSRFLPESPDILFGLKGGMEVYGSMHNTLFGLCAAGIASCLARKYL